MAQKLYPLGRHIPTHGLYRGVTPGIWLRDWAGISQPLRVDFQFI